MYIAFIVVYFTVFKPFDKKGIVGKSKALKFATHMVIDLPGLGYKFLQFKFAVTGAAFFIQNNHQDDAAYGEAK
jgi:hypothetical protein